MDHKSVTKSKGESGFFASMLKPQLFNYSYLVFYAAFMVISLFTCGEENRQYFSLSEVCAIRVVH